VPVGPLARRPMRASPCQVRAIPALSKQAEYEPKGGDGESMKIVLASMGAFQIVA